MDIPKRVLGETGVEVTAIGLGGEGILRTRGRHEEARSLIRSALDLGVNYFESARAYGGSEEYLGSEKYELRPRDWDAPGNIKEDLRRLNAVRRSHPALQRLANLRFLHSDNESILAYWKSAPGEELLVAVNLDPHRAQETLVHLPLEELP